MTALPTPAYRDPFNVLADAEQGNVLPVSAPSGSCMGCRHCRSMIGPFGLRWPCARGNEPSQTSGVCVERDED